MIAPNTAYLQLLNTTVRSLYRDIHHTQFQGDSQNRAQITKINEHPSSHILLETIVGHHCIPSFHDVDCYFIKTAIAYALLIHDEKTRDTGGLYVLHPIEVAIHLARNQADTITIAGGLLHDAIEELLLDQRPHSKKGKKGNKEHQLSKLMRSIEQQCEGDSQGSLLPEIREYLDGLSGILDQISIGDDSEYSDYLKGMQNPRTLLIKVADRRHNISTMEKVLEGTAEQPSVALTPKRQLRQIFKNICVLERVREYLTLESELKEVLSQEYGNAEINSTFLQFYRSSQDHQKKVSPLLHEEMGSHPHMDGLVSDTYVHLVRIFDQLYDPQHPAMKRWLRDFGQAQQGEMQGKDFYFRFLPDQGKIGLGDPQADFLAYTLSMISVVETFYSSLQAPSLTPEQFTVMYNQYERSLGKNGQR